MERNSAWPLGAVIEEARKRAGLSIREAAERAQFSRATWDAIESGTRIKRGGGAHEPAHPKPGVIVAAANVVGVDRDTALKLAGYDPKVYNPSSSAPLTRSERTVAQRMALLSPEQLDAVGTVVDAFLADTPPTPPSESGPRSRARLSHPEPARRRTTMSAPEHDETGRDPVIPESRPAESRVR